MNKIVNDVACDVLSLVIVLALIGYTLAPFGSPIRNIIGVIGLIAIACSLVRVGFLLWKNRKDRKVGVEPEPYKPTKFSNLALAIHTVLIVVWLLLLMVLSRWPRPPYLVVITVAAIVLSSAGAVWYFLKLRKSESEAQK